MKVYEREVNEYRELNRFAGGNGMVIFGSSFAKNIPVCELKQSFGVMCDVYNRSISDLSVFDAENIIGDCVISLAPKKIFLQLGETDLERGYRTVNDIVSSYEKLVDYIKTKVKGCEIVIVSVCGNDSEIQPEELNLRLEAMAKKKKCRYADITVSADSVHPVVKAFSMLKMYMPDKISFYDVMTVANV